MSPAEIAWRVQGKVRDSVDRLLASKRRAPVPAASVWRGGPVDAWRGEIAGTLRAAGELPAVKGAEDWRARAIAAADALCAHRIRLFHLEDHPLGDPIRWNFDYLRNVPTPTKLAGEIDYRDVRETGDCKFVWEPSRHQHWVVLGRAYRLTGDVRYAREVLAQLDSWAEQCPFGYGMQWRSPLELGIRLISWVWALELIRPSGLIDAAHADRIVGLAYRHLWDTARKYSKFSSANNHRVGEAAGVYIGASYFAGLRDADRWRDEARRILIDEIFLQTHDDGFTREQASGYHCFSLEFFLLSALVGRRSGQEYPAGYWQRLGRMFEALAVMTEGGSLPMIGDADDGYVLDAGGRLETDALLAVGAALFGRPDWKRSEQTPESVYWILGEEGCRSCETLATAGARANLTSKVLPSSGYYLLQSGERGGSDAVSVVVDCGEIGFGPIAAHGHADALSFGLRIGGQDVLVDPGTYDYFTYRAYRDYFRSTRAHNTIVVDGVDQSESLGLFLWGERATATCRSFEVGPQRTRFVGEHDGYRRLADGVMHRRTIELDGAGGELIVEDQLTGGPARHQAGLKLHFAEGCTVEPAGGGAYRILCGAVEVRLELSSGWSVSTVRGEEDPIAGWVSRGYHRKQASVTLTGVCEWQGRLESRLRLAWRVLGTGADRPEDVSEPAFSGTRGEEARV